MHARRLQWRSAGAYFGAGCKLLCAHVCARGQRVRMRRLSGGDFAITVCATYVETAQTGNYRGIICTDDLGDEPNRQMSEMSFISSYGYPATDAWNPTGRKSTVRCATVVTHCSCTHAPATLMRVCVLSDETCAIRRDGPPRNSACHLTY